MSSTITQTLEIRPVPNSELPPEFKKIDKPFGLEQHHFNFLVVGVLTHSLAVLYFFYLLPFGHVPVLSLPLIFVINQIFGFGVTVGCHRLWSHRTFKANLPLQIILMLQQTSSGQHPIFKWSKDHRLHHKYTDTNADPHNSTRGLWFSHIGWLFQPKHPELQQKLDSIDVSDLAKDPIVRFQSKYYFQLFTLMGVLVPMGMASCVFPAMSWFHLFVWNFARLSVFYHVTFMVNSIAHLWGDKPYDQYISPTEIKWLSFFSGGEGWHNYHHTFPWDYKAAELGYKFNISTLFIDFFAWIGWAHDMKTVSHKMLVNRINRTGDNSHPEKNVL